MSRLLPNDATETAKAEFRALRNSPRSSWLARADYFERFAANLKRGYDEDLQSWLDGTNTRPDLADPRTPEVAAHRAGMVADMRKTAQQLRQTAPET